jgi:hypothetical protein
VKIFCTHVCKWKNENIKTIPEMGEGEIKENNGGGELNYDIL